MKSTIQYSFRMIIACVFLLSLIYANILLQHQFDLYEHSTLVTVVLLFIGIGTVCVQGAKSVIHILASQKDPSPRIVHAYEQGLSAALWSFSKQRFSKNTRMSLHYGSWGTVIVLFIAMLYSLGVFNAKEGFFLSVGMVRQNYESSKDVEIPVVQFALFTEDNNVKKYLENILHIAIDLRHAGAKVVVARLPFGSVGLSKNSERIKQLTRSIDSLGYVVFAIERDPGNRPSKHQTYTDDITRTVFSSLPGDFGSTGYRSLPDILPWFPLVEFPIGKKMYSEVEVSFPVARKYFGIADSVKPTRIGNEVVLDRIRIPVTNDGKAFCDCYIDASLFLPVTGHRGINVDANDTSEEDTVKYWTDVYQPNALYKSVDEKIVNLDRFRKYTDGKVVLINWYNASELSPSAYPFNGIFVSSVINGVLLGKRYMRNELLFYSLLIVLVLMVGISVEKFAPFWSVFASVLIALVISMVGIWSFFSIRNIIEILYLYIAIILSYLIFSLIKMSRSVAEQKPA